MKKSICAILLCTALTASLLTACGGNSSGTTTTTVPETTTAAETTTEAETTAEAETTTSAETTTAPTDDTTAGIVDNVFSNEQFSVKVPEGWTLNEALGIPTFISPAEPVNGVAANFNIVVTKAAGDLSAVTEEQYKNAMEGAYGTELTMKKFELTELNGEQVLALEFSLTLNNLPMLQTQYICNRDGSTITYTYTSGNTAQPDECEEIFLSIQLA